MNGIIEEVCDELWRALSPEYVNAPTTKGDWKKIASDFYEPWNMPHCVGALDGKHIRMRKPLIRDHYGIIIKGTSVWYF